MVKFTLLLSIFFATFTFAQSAFYGTVLSIHDGDTFNLLGHDGIKYTIRMNGIDTPEIDFNGHSQGIIADIARDYLKTLIPIGCEVMVVTGERFKEGPSRKRVLGQIFYHNIDVNLEMIKAGYAAPYFIYPFEENMVQLYLDAARESFNNKHIKYMTKEAIAPYEFRAKHSQITPSNYIGNYFTHELFSPTAHRLVPIWARLFFKSIEDANNQGYCFIK